VSVDAWLPMDFAIPSGKHIQLPLCEGDGWQLYKTKEGDNLLVVKENLRDRWVHANLLDSGLFERFTFGEPCFYSISSPPDQVLAAIQDCRSPNNKVEALVLAQAINATRKIDVESSLHDGIMVERYSRILPTYTLSPYVDDEVVLGALLTGGIPVSVKSIRRLRSCLTWIPELALREIIEASGCELAPSLNDSETAGHIISPETTAKFELVGRPDLERFMLDQVIDIIENADKYRTLGIDFPSAVVLHGPPGCGKTFAAGKLVEYLGWPSFEINSSSVGSPYIHETSRKIAELFDRAIQNAPSVLVIDEMEAFLADRQSGAASGHHRVEEVAEFLRRIPEAIKNHVLIIAMTNRIEMIDPAILRRGRFDHVVKVDMPSEAEVKALLEKLISELPHADDVNIQGIAEKLSNRPLSDVAFTVRESARLAAKAGKTIIDGECLELAVTSSPSRDTEVAINRKIGF